jgi:GTP-dependent phosphoenolpyruvate carboxykinase
MAQNTATVDPYDAIPDNSPWDWNHHVVIHAAVGTARAYADINQCENVIAFPTAVLPDGHNY